MERDPAVAHRRDRRLGQFVHAHEPLLADPRLDRHAAALRVADAVEVVLDAFEQLRLFEQADDFLAAFEAIHADELLARRLVHRTAIVHHVEDGELVAQADGEVIEVVGGGDLDAAGAELRVGMGVGDDRDPASGQGQVEGLADDVPVPRVVRMDRHRRVAEHRLRACRGHGQVPGAVAQRIADVIEVAMHFAVDHLLVGEGGT